MSRGVNKVILIGYLGEDPLLRYMPSGGAVTNIRIATNESWKDKQTGEQKDRTEWHSITFYNRLAEIAGEYLKKGSQVYVEGKLRTRKYEKDGQTHYVTEIIADQIQMLGSKPHSEPVKDCPQPETAWKPQADTDGFEDESLPF